MTGVALRMHALRTRTPRARALAYLAAAAYTLVAVAVWQGLVALPRQGLLLLVLVYLVPFVLALVALLRRGRIPEHVWILFGTTWIVGGAIGGTAILARSPMLAVGVAGIAVTAVISRRFPAPAIIALFFLSGTYGSVTAFTPVSPGITVDALLAGMWSGIVVAAVVNGRRFTLVPTPGVLLAGAYFVITMAAVFFAPDFNLGLRAMRAAAWHMLAMFVVAYGGWSLGTQARAGRAIAVIALAVGAYATLRWAIGPAAQESRLVEEAGSVQYNQVEGEDKVQGSFPSGHQLGAWAAAMIPWSLAVALTWRHWFRIVPALAVPLLAIGLLGSQNRAGLGGAVVGCAVVLLLNQLSRGYDGPRLGIAAGAVVSLAVAGIVLFPAVIGDNPDKVERYRNILSPSQDKAFQERINKWENAVAEIDDHPFGRGLGTAGADFGSQRFQGNAAGDVDNAYLEIAYEQGFAVMILFVVAMLALLAGLAKRAVWTRDPVRASAAIAASGALAGFLVPMVTGQYFHALIAVGLWVVVGLGLAPFTSLAPGEERYRRPPAASS